MNELDYKSITLNFASLFSTTSEFFWQLRKYRMRHLIRKPRLSKLEQLFSPVKRQYHWKKRYSDLLSLSLPARVSAEKYKNNTWSKSIISQHPSTQNTNERKPLTFSMRCKAASKIEFVSWFFPKKFWASLYNFSAFESLLNDCSLKSIKSINNTPHFLPFFTQIDCLQYYVPLGKCQISFQKVFVSISVGRLNREGCFEVRYCTWENIQFGVSEKYKLSAYFCITHGFLISWLPAFILG